jgi:di/tricarboxylate transporter
MHMALDIWLISAILIIAVFLLITEKLPHDLTAVAILAVLMIMGLLTTEEALRGFANPGVITIGAMFILSRGLVRTGAVELVSDKLIEYSKGNEKRILIMAMIASALPSAFMNNTPVVVLLITVIMSVCCEYQLSPSKFLIPVSYAAIVGGTSTLIGTSTNLIVSELSLKYGFGAIGMFELAPVGMSLTVVAMIYLYFLAPRTLPDHKAPVCELKAKDAPHYLAEVAVPKGSKLIGQDPLAYFTETHPNIELFEVIRGPVIYFPERERVQTMEADRLLLKGPANDLVAVLDKKLVELAHGLEGLSFQARQGKSLILELIITPQSRLVGEHLLQSNLQNELGIGIIAVKRRRTHYSEQKIRHLKLSIGDTLLVHCPRERLDELRSQPDFIILEDVHHKIMNRAKAPVALSIFIGMIAAAASGMADISACAVTAVFLMVLTGCIHLRDAYRSVDVPVLLVITATLALGLAMEKTGAAQVYAEAILTPLRGLSPVFVLSAFILLTTLLTEVMSNSATAVLLIPIAVSTALSIGVDPKPFIVGVCFGATCAFAVPIGYQTHLLIYGPGGYRSADFLKLGIPLDLIAWLLCSTLIPILWPL